MIDPTMKHKRSRQPGRSPGKSGPPREHAEISESELRIIGGSHRGRLFKYFGDRRTRPMKDRVREAVFNLIGPRVKSKIAIDLFAGTGALGFEAISRGADRALLVERHFPTAKGIEANAQQLGMSPQITVVPSDVFAWTRGPIKTLATMPGSWLVLCAPPYALYEIQRAEMMEMISRVLELAPPGSVLVFEAEISFDPSVFPRSELFDVRDYPPARILIAEIPSEEDAPQESDA